MENTESRESKKIVALVILIATVMISTTSATYAWFALSASNATAITGNTATAALTLTVSRSAPATATNMVPQLESALGAAMNGTNKCIDGNGNTICHVYTITVKNGSSATALLTTTITFAHSADVISNGTLSTKGMPNLKWRKTTNTTQLGNYTTNDASIITTQTIEANKSLTANATAIYYIVIWINETSSAQYDSGTFTATINVNTPNGGLTSTIRS